MNELALTLAKDSPSNTKIDRDILGSRPALLSVSDPVQYRDYIRRIRLTRGQRRLPIDEDDGIVPPKKSLVQWG